MSPEPTSQIQCQASAWEQRFHKLRVGRQEERVWFRQGRQASLVLQIPLRLLFLAAQQASPAFTGSWAPDVNPALKRAQHKAGCTGDPWFEQHIPGANRQTKFAFWKILVGLAIDGVRTNLHRSAGRN